MGGPGGAGPNLSLVHSRIGSRENAEDFYKASSCVNCHESIPSNPCNSCHSNKPFSSTSFLLRPSPCNAEMRWPEYLQEGIPGISQHPWWIKQNYLAAQIQKEANPINSQKINFGIEIFLKAKESFQAGDYRLETQEGSKISLHPHLAGKGENLSILLEDQSLLELQNISVRPINWYAALLPNNWLQEIGIKEGRLFLRAAIGALNLFRNTQNPSYSDIDLQDFILPTLPLAYDEKTGEIFNAHDYKSLPESQQQTLHKIEIFDEIDENGQIPALLKLSDLFHLIQQLGKIAEIKKLDPKAEKTSPLKEILTSLHFNFEALPDEIRYPGFYAKFESSSENTLSLNIQTKGLDELESIHAQGEIKLEELFVPQFIHLGTSHAKLTFDYQANQDLSLHLEHIQAQLKANSYFSDNPRSLGWLQILGGSIQEGENADYLGLHFQPGLHLQQLSPGLFELQLNLQVNLRITLSALGEFEIQFPLLFRTQFKSQSATTLDGKSPKELFGNLELIPQTSFLSLPELKIKDRSHQYEANLVFTDIPDFKISAQEERLENGFEGSFILEDTQDSLLKNGWIDFFLPLEIHEGLSYNLNDLKPFNHLEGHSSFKLRDGSEISSQMDAQYIQEGKVEEKILKISAERCNSSKMTCAPLVKNLEFKSTVTQDPGIRHEKLSFTAQVLEWGLLQLIQTNFRFNYTHFENEGGKQQWLIDDFYLSTNPAGSTASKGLLGGPLLIQKFSPKALKLELDEKTHRMKLQDLNLAFDLKRIRLPQLSKFTQRNISAMDLDGKIFGNWDFNTETYEGKGRLLVRGDREGDIHLRGLRGRRLEAALNPLEPNRLYQIPLLADTRFVIRRIEAFDPQSQQLKGHFHLSTLVDWLALKAIGIQWNEHDEFTFDFDHLPYSLEGYSQKIREFFTRIAEQQSHKEQP